jgi:virulence-associated protein VagC
MSEHISALVVDGTAIVYRLYDVGYAIRLDRAFELLGASGPSRVRPGRGEAQAIQIANPPVSARLGTETIVVNGVQCAAGVSVRIFDFGICSIELDIPAPPAMSWMEFSAFGNTIDVAIDLTPVFERHVRELTARIAAAIERPQLAVVTEDYIVFRLTGLRDTTGNTLPASVMRDEDVVPLLLNEHRPLSSAARRELLPHRFSYYEDDLTILTWENALVIEPAERDTDVQYILEFANAQLLELRLYDALLDAELPSMYERAATARASRLPLLGRSVRQVLTTLQTRVADITEPVERVENALKVTDDVYLARVYAAALEIFRAKAWRQGIDRKLAIMRETYEMLNAEAQVARSELLEITIVVLIMAELALALLTRR